MDVDELVIALRVIVEFWIWVFVAHVFVRLVRDHQLRWHQTVLIAVAACVSVTVGIWLALG